jgi:argininosuccinate lyase
MPHKKNPDVFELTRAKCNLIQSLPQQITLIVNNLPSGYFRDLQMTKEVFLPAFGELNDCIHMVGLMMQSIKVNEQILENPAYDLLFSVEKVNQLVLKGTPFRDAYKQVGAEIESGRFKADKHTHHTHEGSSGNLCNDKIAALKKKIIHSFDFDTIIRAEEQLIKV